MRACLQVAVALAAFAFAGGEASAAEKKPKFVVLGIKPVDDSTEKVAASLTEILTTDLAKTGRYDVMGESEIGALLGVEKQKSLMGCTDTACLTEVTGALGCDYLLLGTMGKMGQKLRIDLKIADARKSRIAARDGAMVDSADSMAAVAESVLKSVLAQLHGEPAPVAAVQAAAAQPSSGPGPAPYVVLGVGGAALIAGGVLTGVTLAQKGDLYYNDASTRLTAGLVVGSVGLAAVAAGAIWAAVAPSGAKASVGLAPTVGGATLCAAGTF